MPSKSKSPAMLVVLNATLWACLTLFVTTEKSLGENHPPSKPSFRPGVSSKQTTPAPTFKPGPSTKPLTTPAPTFKPGPSTKPLTTPAPTFKPGPSTKPTDKKAPTAHFGEATKREKIDNSEVPPFKGNTVKIPHQPKRFTMKMGDRPADHYRSENGQAIQIKKGDPEVSYLRGRLDQAKWENRQQRVANFYGQYQAMPVVHYPDPYASAFWWWLLSRSVEEQAMWAYHHRPGSEFGSMSEARYRDLLANNAALEARIRDLEAKGVQRDPTYVPKAVPAPDLVYSNAFVKSVVNTQKVPVQPTGYWLGTCLIVMSFLAGILFIIFVLVAVFTHKW